MSHCYVYHSENLLEIETYSPCGPVNATTSVVECCSGGDSCLVGGICSYSQSQVGRSGYYAAGCTDPSYTDPSCKRICTDKSASDVVYEPTTELWACCDDAGVVNCANPSNETFHLPVPSELATFFSIPATGFTYTSASISQTSSHPLTSSSSTFTAMISTQTSLTSSSSSDGKLSAGAGAGIGVGVGVGSIIFSVAAWILIRKRQKKNSKAPVVDTYQPINTKTELPTSAVPSYVDTPELETRREHNELPTYVGSHEMEARQERSELPE